MNILSLCDKTGIMVRPWLEAGHYATTVDVQNQNSFDGRWSKVSCDVLEFKPYRAFDMVFAFPPCTHLAGSGARWFKDKGLGKLIEALQIVHACHEICKNSGSPWMLENPVGTLSTYMGKPDYYFNPCDYGGHINGDRYTKKTCIWCGSGFVMPLKRPVEPTEGSKMHRLPPGRERANLRSVTPEGFARAVFEANEPVMRAKAA